LAPPADRATPIRGVILTTAELDHTLGLPLLREAENLRVVAHPTVLGALGGLREALRPYTDVTWGGVAPGAEFVLDPGLSVRLLVVGEKPPRYASRAGQSGWVGAVRLTDSATGGSLVYAPCLPQWTPTFADFVAGASALLLDGTFHTDDEMTAVVGRGRSARAMGHVPVVESLRCLAASGIGVARYTHLNNTNPMLDPASEARETLRRAGVDVAEDGEVLIV
jgi:pyrroloquinoline quinone biosynthesis protein B